MSDALAREVLTPKQYEAYRLHRQGYGYRRIAGMLGVDPSSVRARVQAADRRLKAEALKERDNDG